MYPVKNRKINIDNFNNFLAAANYWLFNDGQWRAVMDARRHVKPIELRFFGGSFGTTLAFLVGEFQFAHSRLEKFVIMDAAKNCLYHLNNPPIKTKPQKIIDFKKLAGADYD